MTAVVCGRGDVGGDVAELRINGAVVATSAADQGAGNYASAPLFIGRRGDGTIPANMRLYGLIIRGAATPNATISRVERYLNAKSRAY